MRTAPTPGTHWGIYDHKHRLVTMRPELASHQYRSTFGHELGHAYYGHTGHLAKNERRADAWAAKHLLNFEMVMESARFTVDTNELALSMDVMPWVVKAFVGTLNHREASLILERVRSVHSL